MKTFKLDLISAILLCFITITATYIIFDIYFDSYNSCTSSPLTFAGNKYLKDYGHQFEGGGSFTDRNNKTFVVTFNSTGVYPLQKNPTIKDSLSIQILDPEAIARVINVSS